MSGEELDSSALMDAVKLEDRPQVSYTFDSSGYTCN